MHASFGIITYYEIKILPACNPGYQGQKILKLGNPRKEIRDYCQSEVFEALVEKKASPLS